MSATPHVASGAEQRPITWRWRAFQCIGGLLTIALLIFGFIPEQQPVAQSASASGDLFVLDEYSRILRFDGRTGAFLSIAANPNCFYPPPGVPRFCEWGLLGFDVGPDGKLYVATSDKRILRFDITTGQPTDVFATLTQPANYFGIPTDLAFGLDGDIYVAYYSQVYRYNGKTGAPVRLVAGDPGPYPAPVPRLLYASAIAFGPDGKLYISTLGSASGGEVQRYDPNTGAFLNTFIAPGLGGLTYGGDLAFGPDGNLYITSPGTNQVLRYNGATGAFIDVFIDHASAYPSPNDPRKPAPGGLAFGPDGNVYVSSPYTRQIRRYNGATGAFIDVFIDGGAANLPLRLLFPKTYLAKRSAQAAQIILTQQTHPRLQAAPGDLVSAALVARNRGKGSAKTVTLSMPFDPATVAVVDATFSRPAAWVSHVLSDSLEIQLGSFGSGAVVTGTVRLRVLPGATIGARVAQRLTFRWMDASGGGTGTSNLPTLVVGATAVDGSVAPMAVEPASGPAGTNHVFQVSSFLPGEPVSLWYNAPDGRAVEVVQVVADAAGAIRVPFSTDGLTAGWYAMVAYGTWSASTAVGSWHID